MQQGHREKKLIAEPLRTGELFVQEGLISPEDIDTVLSIQKEKKNMLSTEKHRLFGMILCDLNLVTPVDSYYILNKYNKLMSIQYKLVSGKTFSKELFSQILNNAKHNEIPLISYMLDSDLLTKNKMQQLLFALYHVSLKDIDDVVFNEADKNILSQVIDQKVSSNNRIVPVMIQKNTVVIGITYPSNIILVKELNEKLPQYRFTVSFITFSGFLKMHKALYGVEAEISSHPGGLKSREKPLDLSLLLSFKTAIKNPEQEKESVRTLYERYESLRQLSGNIKRTNLLNDFHEFIIQSHQQITEEFNREMIEFALQKQGDHVKITALPK